MKLGFENGCSRVEGAEARFWDGPGDCYKWVVLMDSNDSKSYHNLHFIEANQLLNQVVVPNIYVFLSMLLLTI